MCVFWKERGEACVCVEERNRNVQYYISDSHELILADSWPVCVKVCVNIPGWWCLILLLKRASGCSVIRVRAYSY